MVTASSGSIGSRFQCWLGFAADGYGADRQDLDPTQYGEADRQAVDPPVEVQVATWSVARTLDWWVRERREWFGRVRGPNGRQRWIKGY
jgi:hypothetical protein